MSLTKNDIINLLYDQTGMQKIECIKIVESFFEIIREELTKGNNVKISGFGNWTVKHKKERKGRNPKTGQDMPISARNVVTFKPSMKLRNVL
jgi:integration host factor subunit alpha